MAKNTKPTETQAPVPEEKTEALSAQELATAVKDQAADVQAELAAARAEIDELTAKLTDAEDEKEALARELRALRSQADKADKKADSREALLVRAAKGKELWRGGVLFTDQWQTVKRAEVGETAWARITGEPALERKEAE
ncbi:hypothetical protein [Bergeriella denitrificans]|uniref:Uncharacterized protein n=1 Tax=Bergeriella denitrificans TaxID=494 RepID=A0A378UFN4_BERDE|nr:hypothetical protein [Bergeriella denitrificans]STZ75563.1 Uncharacterised protein [Bergeriella denitrificans]